MTRAVISRTVLHCIWRWLNFLSVSACPVLLFIGDWNAGRADPAWVRWEVTQYHNNVAPGSPAHPDQPSPISVNNFPSPPTTSHHYNEISGLISIYGSTAARMRTGNPHRQSNRITAEFTQFWNLQSFLAEKNTKPQLLTWTRQAPTFLEPGMRNVELNHLWNVKELAKLICNWDKWRVLIFLLPASPQPAQLSADEVVPPEAVCHVWPISFSYLISITGFVFPQPIYLALLENSDQDCHQQLYQTMQWC